MVPKRVIRATISCGTSWSTCSRPQRQFRVPGTARWCCRCTPHSEAAIEIRQSAGVDRAVRPSRGEAHGLTPTSPLPSGKVAATFQPLLYRCRIWHSTSAGTAARDRRPT